VTSQPTQITKTRLHVGVDHYEAASLRHKVQRVFNGAPDALLRRLAETACRR